MSGLPNLRLKRLFRAIRDAIRAGQRDTFRICHFSVQSNHMHLLVEAESREALSRGVQGLTIRLAKAVNRVLMRRGSVWRDRYHRHDLATPREVRSALVYVLMNVKKHQRRFTGLDPCSSAAWFTGWHDRRTITVPPAVGMPVLSPRTWLLVAGWRRAGPVRSDDVPAAV